MPVLSRSLFLLAAAAAPLATEFPAQAQTLKRSLVLSGGGALGAYEAGVVAALVRAANVGEGQPLPQYGAVTGASIGALNGYLVATAQWAKLRELWSSVSEQNAVRVKPQFAKIKNESSGVGNRVAQAIALATGVKKNVAGIYDGDHLQAWLDAYIDFSKPVVTPFVWAVTNLTRKLPEYFFVVPPGIDPARRRIALAAVSLAVGRVVPIREATPAILAQQLRASASVPVGFDPVLLPGPDGALEQYCDGGVTANTPIAAASALSNAVDVVLLSPPNEKDTYHDIIDVIGGTYGTMQRRIMYDALRTAALQALLFRSIKNLPTSALRAMGIESEYDPAEISALAELLGDTNFFILRPRKALPGTLLGFDDADAIQQSYQLGASDAAGGFAPLTYAMLDD
ncbi:MAG TPA: patatin-like phospholipase family protein [Candidatus Lustribacter sp.]|jgi:predicted acylesterase/phospholipase RssA|nr:patatin-like phospholipase family protein [Candidatus Lustribacter sp.]